jgi:cathepsin D
MYEAYGTGEASGIWAIDRVEMGGYFVNDQPIALVQQGTVAQYMGSQLSGIMGLGVPSISLQGPNGPAMKAPPPFWITTAENVWTDKQFGVFLARYNTDPSTYLLSNSMTETRQTNGGVLTLGGLNRQIYTGEINYMPANTTYWWQLPLEGFSVNGKKFNARLAPTVIDTGSTAIMMPDAAVRAFHAQIPGAQEPNNDNVWVIPCNTVATASFYFGGKEYPIQTADILRGAVASDPRYCLSNVGAGAWLLGAAFMKNYYTAFRMSPEPAIGFASLSPNYVNNGKVGSTGGPVQSNQDGGSSIKSGAVPVTVSATVLALGLVASLLL